MKIGIMSFPHSRSLGCMLQMRCLYHAVEQEGHEAEIINYVCDDFIYRRKRKLTLKDVIIAIINKIFIKTPRKSFKEFEGSLKMFPSNPICSDEMLEEVEKHFDRIIVGSDQVWNFGLTGDNMNFYLKYCKDNSKKTSYAASFGVMDLEEKHKPKVAELLSYFGLLSVREKQGQEIIENLTGRKAELVLDPTLLVDAKFLRSLASENKIKKDYVLFYNIKPSPTLLNHARKYAKENNLRLITIGGRIVDHFHPFRYPQFDVGPKEFLSLVDNAQCIFTNSFHGMAVSVALHKDFYVEFSTDTNSRLVNLAQMLELENRIIESKTPTVLKIDYTKTDLILSEYKKQSSEFLKKILSVDI